MERLYQRDAEALVLREVERDGSLAVRVRQPVVVERARELDVSCAELRGESRQPVEVRAADRLACAQEPRVRGELPLEVRERSDDEVVPLVRSQPPHVQHERPVAVPPVLRDAEQVRLEQDRHDAHVVSAGFAQLARVVLGHRDGDVHRLRVARQVIAAYLAQRRHVRLEVPEVTGGRHVVVDEQLAVGQVERRLEPRRIRRVVDQQQVLGAGIEPVERVHRLRQARLDRGRVDVARDPPAREQVVVRERLPGDGVEWPRGRQQLVNAHGSSAVRARARRPGARARQAVPPRRC